MGKLDRFELMFYQPKQVYYSGEVISGQLTVSLGAEMKMRKIKISLRGRAHCHWTEQHGSGNNRRTVSYTGNEELIHGMEVIVFGSEGRDSVLHPAGEYVYRFQFTLPPALPSSFEARHGYIRYFVKGTIDKPWKFDHNSKVPFVVNEVIDTNNPMYLHQPGGELSKEVGCCCCPSGVISLRGNCDRQAYCPGEQIAFSADVNNASDRDMRCVKVKIIKRIEYHATSKTKVEEHTIVVLEGPPISKRDTLSWRGQVLNVPPTNPSILGCRVVQVHYFLKVEVDLPYGFDPKVLLPIVLGTVPFRATYGMAPLSVPSMPPPMPMGFDVPPAMPLAPFGYADMPPPSYAAAVGQEAVDTRDDEDNKYTYGNLSYTPIYTYVNPSAPPM